MKFKIVTLGCKVNAYESEIIKEKFLENNYILDENNPNIIIVNTCSVTNMADNKSKKLIRREKKLHPQAILVACGCMSQNHQNDLDDLGINILIGNKDKSKIVFLVEKYLKEKHNIKNFYDMQEIEFEDMQVNKFTSQTRAFLKIQDGCNNYCSYCVIPYLRGIARFKNFQKALAEAKALVKSGHKEIVLTGIHTGSYYDSNHDLTDLVIELAKINGLERIRISSIEIVEITDKFLEMLKNTPKVCNHLHIPLQSGSDEVLKAMNRRYNTQKFIKIVKKIRAVRPDISLTTDLIVGFPGETEQNFQESYELCQKLEFSKIHVFPYSQRDKTKAAEMPKQIDETIKKQRAHQMLELSNQLEEKYYQKFINQKVNVLIERVYEDYSIGHTSNYIPVTINEKLKENTEYEVIIQNVSQKNVNGIISNCVILN